MKRIFAILLILASLCPTYAREPQRGYRGFFEWDNSFGNMTSFNDAAGEDVRDFQWLSGLSTTHGYQINNHVFVGAGFLIEFGTPSLDLILPVFADFRYDYSINKFRPFGDLKIGYNINGDGGGIYFSPTIGHRFNWGRKLGLNLGLGLTVLGRTTDVVDNEVRYMGARTKWTSKHSCDCFFTVRIGIDF